MKFPNRRNFSDRNYFHLLVWQKAMLKLNRTDQEEREKNGKLLNDAVRLGIYCQEKRWQPTRAED